MNIKHRNIDSSGFSSRWARKAIYFYVVFFQKKMFYQQSFAKIVRINLSYEEAKVIGLEFGPHNPLWFFL